MELFFQRQLDGSLNQVPGLGEKAIKALGKYSDGDFPSGIHTVWQLCAKFFILKCPGLTADGHLREFSVFLVHLGCPLSDVNTVVQACAQKLAFGIQVPITASKELLTSSRMSDENTRRLLDQATRGICDSDPAKAFKGAGLGPVSLERLRQQGIETTWQIIGKLLSTCSDEQHNSPDVFLAWLAEIGVAPSWRKTVAVAVTELVSAGVPVSSTLDDDNDDDDSDSATHGYVSPVQKKRKRPQFHSPLAPIPEKEKDKEKKRAAGAIAAETLRKRIRTFYTKYCPSKLAGDPTFVKRTAAKYSYPGGDTALFKFLTAKYGPEPSNKPTLSFPLLGLAALVLVAMWMKMQQCLRRQQETGAVLL